MRTVFRAGLAALDAELIDLSRFVTQTMHRATSSVLETDLTMAESVISELVDLEDRTRVIAERAAHIVAQQQPVAQDLRSLLAAQRVATCLLRMARQVGDVAKTTRRRYPRMAAAPEVRGVVTDLGELAQRIGGRVTAALAGHDVSAGSDLVAMDRMVGRLHGEMLAIVGSSAWPYDVATAVDLTLLSRSYTAFADYAVEVGAAVVYVETGVPTPTHMR